MVLAVSKFYIQTELSVFYDSSVIRVRYVWLVVFAVLGLFLFYFLGFIMYMRSGDNTRIRFYPIWSSVRVSETV